MPSRDIEAPAAGRMLGAYRILREIGRGGMGSVYLGEHNLLGRQAAVKVLLPEMSANHAIVTRFFNEARAATSIRHLGIVEVYDFGFSEDGQAYIAMEFLQGQTLAQRIERRPLAVGEVLTVTRQLLGPLAAAHRAGIAHRDLKPDNIYLIPDDEVPGGERVKLLDFGIAKLFGELGGREQTQSGAIIGTPTYMAPEQCRGVAVDHRVDLYAVGCILYKLLTGRAVFDGEGPGDVMLAHVYQAPIPPSVYVAGLDPAVDALVLRLLAKRPDDRYQKAEDVVAALDHLTGATPAVGTLPSTGPSWSGVGGPPSAGTLTSAAHGSGSTSGPPARLPWFAALAGLAGVVAVAAVVVALGSSSDDTASAAPVGSVAVVGLAAPAAPADIPGHDAGEPVPPAPLAVIDAAPPPLVDAAAPPPTVVLALASRPAGARVTVDGRLVGTTPVELTWPRDDRPLTVTVAREGYRTERVQVLPAADLQRTVTLRKAAATRAHAPNPFDEP